MDTVIGEETRTIQIFIVHHRNSDQDSLNGKLSTFTSPSPIPGMLVACRRSRETILKTHTGYVKFGDRILYLNPKLEIIALFQGHQSHRYTPWSGAAPIPGKFVNIWRLGIPCMMLEDRQWTDELFTGGHYASKFRDMKQLLVVICCDMCDVWHFGTHPYDDVGCRQKNVCYLEYLREKAWQHSAFLAGVLRTRFLYVGCCYWKPVGGVAVCKVRFPKKVSRSRRGGYPTAQWCIEQA